jgi:hypothetical protein
LLRYTGTVDSSGSTTSILRDTSLTRFGNDTFNGMSLLLTSGSPNYTELFVKKTFSEDGDLLFAPELNAAPDSLTYELSAFTGQEFLDGIVDSIGWCYDKGWLTRTHWSRMVAGSPVYNADFSYWDAAATIHGWTATTATLSRERGASANIALSETSVALTTLAGRCTLDASYQRYLNDFKGNTITMYCLVKATDASNARISFNNGSDNFSAYHSGSGNWEWLSVEVNTANTDTAMQLCLVTATTTTAYFNMPFVSTGSRVYEYPFTIATMPDGPSSITAAQLDISQNELATDRGLGSIRQMGPQIAIMNGQVRKHHDENTSTQVGILDFSASRFPPRDGALLWLRGDGPLTVPTAVLSTDSIEVNETESLLLCKMAAVNILERKAAGTQGSVRTIIAARISDLNRQLIDLSDGAGEVRDVATYSLNW